MKPALIGFGRIAINLVKAVCSRFFLDNFSFGVYDRYRGF